MRTKPFIENDPDEEKREARARSAAMRITNALWMQGERGTWLGEYGAALYDAYCDYLDTGAPLPAWAPAYALESH